MAHIAFEHVTFSYPHAHAAVGRLALDDVCLSIEEGEFVVLCGKSGCGKTTLLRHMKSVLSPHGALSGRVLYRGEPLANVPALRQCAEIGFVMQDPDAQIVTDKVWHELAFGLESLGVDERTMRLRVAEMAGFFGIEAWFHEDVRNLSGGQKQLLNLASVMAMQPSLLILDEPTSQLDPIAASDFLNTVSKINQELGTTVVLTEHRLEDVFARADSVVVMDAGRVVSQGDPREVGKALLGAEDDMAIALPVPLRVSHAVQAACETSSGCEGVAVPAFDGAQNRPLTVREGRTWLKAFFDGAPGRGELPGYSEPSNRAARPACPVAPASAASADFALELKGAWMRYGRDLPDVLCGVDLRIPRGSLFAVMGGNGVGKSTLLKVIAGVEKAYRGRVKVGGRVAMLPQDPQNLFSKDVVLEELEEMLAFAGRDGEGRVRAIAQIMGLEAVLDAHPYDLSGGEQQRVALAKILLTGPDVLLLDEPTKGLDALFKRELAAILGSLAREGVTVVMVSHDVEFCARYAHEVALFFDGSVLASAPPRRFFAENGFYTTAASRMGRRIVEGAIVEEDLVKRCIEGLAV